MRVYKLNKPFIRHFAFFYMEFKSALFTKYFVKGKFKFLKRLYVRIFINYFESYKYYLSKIFNKKKLSENANYNINTDGIEFLENIKVENINFLEIETNRDNNQITTKNKIDFNEGEKFARHMGFHTIAMNYLNTSKCNFYINSWNTYAYNNDDQLKTGLWHRDRDGIKLLKFFIYLSDVDEKSGPHYFVSGSHKNKPLRFVPQFRYEDIKVKEYYKDHNFIKVTGKKGTCFMEDTTGIHRGSKPDFGKHRSILSYCYFTGPLYYEKNCEIVDLKEKTN